ncbi:MAG TPA: ferric reductase-like transmembrane domain-containing protein [Acidimicrobiales bacterium]
MIAASLSWYVARSGGLVAWLTCAAAVGWGLTLSSRLVRKRGAPAWLLASHRFLGLLSVVFVGVHLVGLYLDKYVPFGPAELFIPFRATYKPLAVAWGIVAFYLLLAVEVSSLLMRRIPKKWWHRIHLSSLLLLVLATVHGFTAGTDRSNVLARWVALVISAALIFIATFRVLADRKAQRADRSAAIAAARARQNAVAGEPATATEPEVARAPVDQEAETAPAGAGPGPD